ncbi:DUF397 domain-containing protein [Streptomyces sp. NPDC059445]|uniref:DUF397 domain-containing protein n=1 Tax=Streptomyces sp. NPDC059445 TaxID=3346832 RepID=UPI0036B29DE7
MPYSWRKSSYSTTGPNCVEVANLTAAVLVRDSKDTAQPHVRVSAASWALFQRSLAHGEI